MEVKIEEFDHFGRGISKDLGKVCFIENALKEKLDRKVVVAKFATTKIPNRSF